MIAPENADTVEIAIDRVDPRTSYKVFEDELHSIVKQFRSRLRATRVLLNDGGHGFSLVIYCMGMEEALADVDRVAKSISVEDMNALLHHTYLARIAVRLRTSCVLKFYLPDTV
ncbi:hypothetical protein OK016_28095 [Vibrio chagasii]|nr:hypothetical protein [Vibrio chagasii]